MKKDLLEEVEAALEKVTERPDVDVDSMTWAASWLVLWCLHYRETRSQTARRNVKKNLAKFLAKVEEGGY